jgi:hypothetical protein
VRRRLRWVTWERFHALRLVAWTVQVPIAITTQSIPYLGFLSIAALMESALTDLVQARQARKRGEAVA